MSHPVSGALALSRPASVQDKQMRGVTINDYQILTEFTRSASGAVYKARRRTTNEVCIIKEKHASELGRDHSILHEVQILSSIDHPHVIRCIGWFWGASPGSVVYIVLEYAERGDLHSLIETKRRLGQRFSEPEVWEMMVHMCEGVAAVHAQGIIHRDLKTQNIFIDAKGSLKVGDFGIGRIRSDQTALVATFSYATPLYMSPEFIENRPYNDRTDVWAVGVILYEMLCFKPPFAGRSLAELVRCISKGQYESVPSTYSKPLRALVTTLLETDFHHRPSVRKVLEYCRHFRDQTRAAASHISHTPSLQDCSDAIIMDSSDKQERPSAIAEARKEEEQRAHAQQQQEELPRYVSPPKKQEVPVSSGPRVIRVDGSKQQQQQQPAEAVRSNAVASREDRYRQRLMERRDRARSVDGFPDDDPFPAAPHRQSEQHPQQEAVAVVPVSAPKVPSLDVPSSSSAAAAEPAARRASSNRVFMADPPSSARSQHDQFMHPSKARLLQRQRERPDGEMVDHLGASAQLRALQSQLESMGQRGRKPAVPPVPMPMPVESAASTPSSSASTGRRKFNILSNQWEG